MGERRLPAKRREVSYNLAGQRLGKKGQVTRERILAAALRLLAAPQGPPINLTNIAREASVSLTNLYLYFPDFGALLLAAMARVMDAADEAFIEMLRPRWPDDQLQDKAREFLRSHHLFWREHARVLQLRNRLSEDDQRILEHRQRTIMPMLELLTAQMDCPANPPDLRWTFMATVVLTGFERMTAVLTASQLRFAADDTASSNAIDEADALIQAEAWLLELAIRDGRAQAGRFVCGSSPGNADRS